MANPNNTRPLIKDTGEYQSDQVHDFQVGHHELEDEPPPTVTDDDASDTGEYQSDQVRQIRSSRH